MVTKKSVSFPPNYTRAQTIARYLIKLRILGPSFIQFFALNDFFFLAINTKLCTKIKDDVRRQNFDKKLVFVLYER